MKKNNLFKTFLSLCLCAVILLGTVNVNAATPEKIDWRTHITEEDFDVDKLFKEYDEPKTLYTTTGVHMRVYPNTESESVTVLKKNIAVEAVADYNGWTKVAVKNEKGEERFYYIWNKYLYKEIVSNWKTYITPEKIDIDDVFEEYIEPKTLYTTTGVHMRAYPNVGEKSIETLKRNTEVTAVADYQGWTKVVVEEDGTENYYYIWNKYLSDKKTEYATGGSYLGTFKLTAYCNCSTCCGKWAGGNTASGAYPTAGRTVAMGGIPFGTKLLINGHVYTVEDRGTPYGHVDIYFNSHSEARNFGLQYADVYIIQ